MRIQDGVEEFLGGWQTLNAKSIGQGDEESGYFVTEAAAVVEPFFSSTHIKGPSDVLREFVFPISIRFKESAWLPFNFPPLNGFSNKARCQ